MLAKIIPDIPVSNFACIKLSHGKACIVDADLYDELRVFGWFAKHSGSRYYACRWLVSNGIKKLEFMHRRIAKPEPHHVTHHINGNSLDNRRCNLQNMLRGEHDIVHFFPKYPANPDDNTPHQQKKLNPPTNTKRKKLNNALR